MADVEELVDELKPRWEVTTSMPPELLRRALLATAPAVPVAARESALPLGPAIVVTIGLILHKLGTDVTDYRQEFEGILRSEYG